MANNTDDFPLRTSEEQKPSQPTDDSKASPDMWQDFVDNTTLHGIRHVFIKRHILIRLTWLVLLLSSGGYYIFAVYRAFDKYYSYPINTVLSTKHVKMMDGMCYTFNSGTNGSKVKTVDSAGIASGLSVILDARTHDAFAGISLGLNVLVHGQGEHVDVWGGIDVTPGQDVIIILSKKKVVSKHGERINLSVNTMQNDSFALFACQIAENCNTEQQSDCMLPLENLKKPYATNCSEKSLKTFSSYTLEGCLYECDAENIAKTCHLGIPVCTSDEDEVCTQQITASLDHEVCDCHVPCTETKYITEVSYSQFPDTDFANKLISSGYDKDVQYQRDNLVYLEVGFKSLSYELQKEQPAYDSNSLFGEIGGNMGLFLGCSLLTICEFFDFIVRFLAARKREIINPA